MVVLPSRSSSPSLPANVTAPLMTPPASSWAPAVDNGATRQDIHGTASDDEEATNRLTGGDVKRAGDYRHGNLLRLAPIGAALSRHARVPPVRSISLRASRAGARPGRGEAEHGLDAVSSGRLLMDWRGQRRLRGHARIGRNARRA